MAKRKLLSKRQKRQLIYAGTSLVLAGSVWLGQRYGLIKKIDTTKNDTPGTIQQNQPGLYSVKSFEDGDTITVNMSGNTERIRMIGVDTPETQDPRVPVQCFGKAASEFTKTLIGNQPVRLEADPTNTNRDRYNRLLRYVYLPDGRLVNAEIIGQGYGFAYVLFPFEKMDEFKNLEKQAREQNLGLWGSCQINQNGNKKTTNSAQ